MYYMYVCVCVCKVLVFRVCVLGYGDRVVCVVMILGGEIVEG